MPRGYSYIVDRFRNEKRAAETPKSACASGRPVSSCRVQFVRYIKCLNRRSVVRFSLSPALKDIRDAMTGDTAAFVILGLYLAVAVACVVWQARRCPSGPMIWWLYVAERLVAGLLWRVRWVDRDGRPRRCPFPADSGALIVANHRSPVDPMVLWQNHHFADGPRSIRPISFMMAREFYENRWLNWFYRAMRSIPVTRGGSDHGAVRSALQHLKAGDLVGLFPEGGINKGPPGLKSANPGVAFLALNGRAPVYPVYIADAPVRPSMVRAVFVPSRVRLVAGDPIDLSAYRTRRKSQELLHEVTDLVMTAIADLGGVRYEGSSAGDAKPADPPRKPAADKKPAEDGKPAAAPFPRLADDQENIHHKAI